MLKKLIPLGMILCLMGCSTPWNDHFRVLDDLDENILTSTFVRPEPTIPLRFSPTIFGLTDHNITSIEEAHTRFPNTHWDHRVIALGKHAGIFNDKNLYFYGENAAKHKTYQFSLTKDDIHTIKKLIPANAIAWVESETEATYLCEKEYAYPYHDRCGYGSFDQSENHGQAAYYTRPYDEALDKASKHAREQVADEREARRATWDHIKKEGNETWYQLSEKLYEAFLPSEYFYYCTRHQDYFYHCTVSYQLHLLIPKL